MNVVVFESLVERVRGLQYRSAIEPATLFVFPDTEAGAVFHSRNVPEPFDIAFLSAKLAVLRLVRVHPPKGIAVAPPGTSLAVEAKAGELQAWNFVPGKVAFYGAFPGDGAAWR